MDKVLIFIGLMLFGIVMCFSGALLSNTYISGWWASMICTLIIIRIMDAYKLH